MPWPRVRLFPMSRLQVLVLAACASCGTPSSNPAPVHRPMTRGADAGVAADAGLAADAVLVADTAVDASLPAVTVELGLDLRALPTHTSPEHIDMFVLAQGDRMRELTPAGVDLEIRHVPGWGVLYAVFRAPSLAGARAACNQVVKAFMADPPHLPILPPRGKAPSAASITTPCHDGVAP